MLGVATEISQLVHAISTMDTLAEKVASAQGSALVQQSTSQASNDLYNVIVKVASDQTPHQPRHKQVVDCVCKIAQLTGKPAPIGESQQKLAAAVVVDETLSEVIPTEENQAERTKLAEARAYGREFVMSLLKEVI